MNLVVAIIVFVGAAVLVGFAGYLLGVRRGEGARDRLRTRITGLDRELAQARGRATARAEDGKHLEAAIARIVAPLVAQQRSTLDPTQLDAHGADRNDMVALLDRLAAMGNLSAVLLCDAQGWPIASSTRVRDGEKLAATASLLLLAADRLTRDGTPAPLSLMIGHASGEATLCRLFDVGGQRLALTATAMGDGQLTPQALDPALVRIEGVLLDKQRVG